MDKPSYLNFDKASYAWRPNVDYRANPEPTASARANRASWICEPYKGELVPLAVQDAGGRHGEQQGDQQGVPGVPAAEGSFGRRLARKFLQIGLTRARRYTNYKGGRKYDPKDKHQLETGTGDPQKAASAHLLRGVAEGSAAYAKMKAE